MFYDSLTPPELCGFRIWDLAVERDAEGEDEFESKMQDHVKAPEDLPPQLLFVHQVVLSHHLLHWPSRFLFLYVVL